MATLMNNRKLAAVSRKTPGQTKNSQSQNTPNPGTAEKYITQSFDEIEGKVTKNHPKKQAGRNHAISVPCLKSMNFFWAHKFALVP